MERKTVVIAQSDLERQKAVCEQIREYWLAQGRTPLAFVDTYGCQQNEADSEKRRGYLAPSGYAIGTEAEGADVGIYCAHNPMTPTIHVKLLRAVTRRESQPSTGATADPLGRRGAVVAGPAYGPVPSHV